MFIIKMFNIKNMNYMFFECSSLLLLPDLIKWSFINAKNSFIFSEHLSLLSLHVFSN